MIRMSHLHVKVVAVGGSALGCVQGASLRLTSLETCQESRVKSSQVLTSQGQSCFLTNYLIKTHFNTPCLYARTLAWCVVRERGGLSQNDRVMQHWTQSMKINLKTAKSSPKIPHGFDFGSYVA